MHLPEISRAELPASLAQGTWVVTATRRLARALQLEYARSTRQPSWLTPRILPWSAWVQQQYRELRDFGRLARPRRGLDDAQAAAVWEEVLAGDEVAGRLLLSGGATDGFRDAWSLVHEWRLPWGELHARAGEDCRVFLRAAQAYQRRLDQLDAVDGAQLPELVRAALEEQPAGATVAFAGFDRFTPAQQAVVGALGHRARRVAGPQGRAVAKVHSFTDGLEELGAVAAWARRQLAARPDARIGIVVPDLAATAAVLEPLLDDALAPIRLWPGHERDARPWNISLARPLAETPLVDAALRLLGFAQQPESLGTVSRVLRSPFLGGATREASPRARLEAWLRAQAGDPVGPQALLAGLRGEGRAPACPVLAAGLERALATLGGGSRRRAPGAWAADFSRALQALGWPGDAPLDSEEWQATQAWSECLDALAGLDAVTGVLSLPEALARLRRIARERRFQAESPDVPVQVLGLPETAGLEFDALWVTGLHDGVLPASQRPCPLLPAALQRERGLPRACPETEQSLARALLQRLAASAGTTWLSFPAVEADEPLRPSPVLGQFGVVEPGPVGGTGVAGHLFASRQLSAFADEAGPPVAGSVRGGSGLLADQSACPFRAFALHRLQAGPLEQPQAGVDPRQRGSFLHHALRLLWEEWGSSAAAAALDPGARLAAIRQAAWRSAAQHLAGMPRGLVEIEVEAGQQVMAQLLDADLARVPFTIAGCEQPFEIELGALRIRGRMDRIDRVGEALVVIDYKTGAPAPADWDGERPGEPQMPLYALALEEAVSGLAYACLKPGEVGYRGRLLEADPPPMAGTKLKSASTGEWASMLAAWRKVLGRLAGQYAAGHAAVDPLHPTRQNGSCAYCPLPALCRRDELLRMGALGDD